MNVAWAADMIHQSPRLIDTLMQTDAALWIAFVSHANPGHSVSYRVVSMPVYCF